MCWKTGPGQLLFEHNSLSVLAEQAQGGPAEKEGADRRPRRARLVRGARDRSKRSSMLMVLEGEELLVHCVPQLAALA